MSILICSSVKPTTKVSPTVKSKKVVPAPKAARFAEVVNGRAAMQGMLWGSMNWAMSGENILQQVEDPMYALAATGVVTTLAAASLITVKDFDDEEFWSFTPRGGAQEWETRDVGIHHSIGVECHVT